MIVSVLFCFLLYISNGCVTLAASSSCDADSSSNACLLNELKSLKTEVQSLKQELQAVKTQGLACPTVAFRAQLANRIQNPNKGYHLVYQDVKLNIGNGYNAHHGNFVAPATGIYFLSYHVTISPGNTNSLIRIVMKRNGEIISHSMNSGVPYWVQDTYTDIVYLTKGDEVWIEVLENNFAFAIEGNTAEGPHSVFEGFLISC